MLYTDLRHKIQTGDLIFWSGTSITARAIKWWTKSHVNHVSTVVRIPHFKGLYNRVFIVEALGSGLELRLLSERMRQHPDDRVYWMHLPLDAMQRSTIGGGCISDVSFGYGYDFRGVLGYVFRFLPQNVKRYYCSEHAHDKLVDADYIDPMPKPSPAALWDYLADGALSINEIT